MIEVALAIVQCRWHRFLGTGRINREEVFRAGILDLALFDTQSDGYESNDPVPGGWSHMSRLHTIQNHALQRSKALVSRLNSFQQLESFR